MTPGVKHNSSTNSWALSETGDGSLLRLVMAVLTGGYAALLRVSGGTTAGEKNHVMIVVVSRKVGSAVTSQRGSGLIQGPF